MVAPLRLAQKRHLRQRGWTLHYPIYVHRCDGGGYRGSFADFPDIELSANSLEDLARAAQGAVQRVYDQSEHIIPEPTGDTVALQALEIDDEAGLWLFVDIDLTDIVSTSARVPINLRKSVLRAIDAAARTAGVSRSTFVARACVHELGRAGVTERCSGRARKSRNRHSSGSSA